MIPDIDDSTGAILLTLVLLVAVCSPSVLEMLHPPSRGETDLTRAYRSLSADRYEDSYQHVVADAEELAHGKIPDSVLLSTDQDALYDGRRHLTGTIQQVGLSYEYDPSKQP